MRESYIFAQIKLFREVEGIINVINTLTSCCCSGCCEKIERLIKKKSPASFTATLTSKYVKYVAIWCGDEIKDIIQQAQDLSENEVKYMSSSFIRSTVFSGLHIIHICTRKMDGRKCNYLLLSLPVINADY